MHYGFEFFTPHLATMAEACQSPVLAMNECAFCRHRISYHYNF